MGSLAATLRGTTIVQMPQIEPNSLLLLCEVTVELVHDVPRDTLLRITRRLEGASNAKER
jgi:hypothetical protein